MSKFIANSDDSYVISTIQNQEETDTDWFRFQASEKTKASINIDPSSTNTILNTADLNRKMYKTLLYNSTDGAKIGKLKFSSQGSNYNSYQILDAALTQPSEKAHLIAQTKDLSTYINTTNTTTTQLVLENNLEDEILVREGDTLIIANDADGILELENFSISRTLSTDGTKQVYTIDISSLSLSSVPTTVEVIKPLMDVSVSNAVGAENIPLNVDTSQTTTTEVYFNYDSLSDTKKDIVQNAQKVDLDTGLNINSTFKNGNVFSGYPVEFSHYGHWSRHNLTKVTTGPSGSTTTITDALPSKARIPQIFVLKNKVYIHEGQVTPSLMKAEINENGIVGDFTIQPQGAAPNSYGTPFLILGHRVYIFSTNGNDGNYNIYYIDFDDNGDLIQDSWQLYSQGIPINTFFQPAFITKNKVCIPYYDFSDSSKTGLYWFDIDGDDLVNYHFENRSDLPNPYTLLYAVTTTRFYLIKNGTVYYAPINPDGTLGTFTSESMETQGESLWSYDALVTKNKLYYFSKSNNGYMVEANIDENGVITDFNVKYTDIDRTVYTQFFVTKSRIYLVGYTNATKDLRWLPFDGWEQPKASQVALGSPYLSVPEQPQPPTKAIIRPNLQEVIKINTEETTYNSANDEVNIKYNKVEVPDARKIQVKWNSPIANAENSELRVDLWKKV